MINADEISGRWSTIVIRAGSKEGDALGGCKAGSNRRGVLGLLR